RSKFHQDPVAGFHLDAALVIGQEDVKAPVLRQPLSVKAVGADARNYEIGRGRPGMFDGPMRGHVATSRQDAGSSSARMSRYAASGLKCSSNCAAAAA